MNFPSNQALFPDIGPDGKPDPSKFSGGDTVSSVFHRTVKEHPISSVSLHVSYRRSIGFKESGPTDYEITSAIAGIVLNAILPGKDYEFGSDVTDGRSGDFGRY